MSGVLPISALLRRELVTQLRTKRSIVLLLAIALMMIWMIAAAWPSGNVVWAMLPGISQGIVTGFSFMLLVGAALFIPGLAATTVVVEKERRSWDLLALTLLRPSGIIAGKLLSAVGMYLIYVIAVFPMLATVFFLVGIDWFQLARSLALVLITCVTCGAVGMACSAMSRKTVTAMAASYFGMSLVMGLPTLVLAVFISIWVGYFGYSLPQFIEPMTASMSPFFVLMETTLGSTRSSTLFLYNVAYQAAITAVALLVTVRALRRPAKVGISPRDEDDPRSPVKGLSMRERLRRRRRRFRKPRPPIHDRYNPIFVREMQWGLAGSRRAYYWTILLLVGMSLALTYGVEAMGGSTVEVASTVLSLHGILISCLVPTLLAGSFTREYELRSFDMLRMTLITPWEVVRGKFLAGLRLALVLSLCSLLANAPNFLRMWLWDGPLRALLAGHVSLFVCALLAANLALFASAITKRTSTAIVTSFCFVLFAYFGVFFLLALFEITVGWRLSDDVVEYAAFRFSSPVIGYFASIENSRNDFRLEYTWIVNVVEFTLVIMLVYYATQSFYRRYRVRER